MNLTLFIRFNQAKVVECGSQRVDPLVTIGTLHTGSSVRHRKHLRE